MKIVLVLHELVISGTSVNAIELATKLKEQRGFEVILFAPRGPMLELALRSGLRYVPAPQATAHPFLPRVRALRALVRKESPDLVHVWETWALLDAFYGVYLPMRVPLLLTDMQMFVAPILPRKIPTTFGTHGLVESARASGIRNVHSLLPPVDLAENCPSSHESAEVRTRLGVAPNEVLLVIVSRLAHAMKGESLRLAIDAVGELGETAPVRLLIVGDGPARDDLEARANAVNARLDRPAITFAGAMLDPRPAYAAADVVIGMGSSAMRGMAYRKPVIVVGERGFARILTPDTAEYFAKHGLFGQGAGQTDRHLLQSAIQTLVGCEQRRQTLADFAFEYVNQHHSLDLLTQRLGDLCESAARTPPSRRDLVLDLIRTTAIYLRERRFLWRAPKQTWHPQTAGLGAPQLADDAAAST